MQILINGTFLTQNPKQPVVEALAIEQGKISATGSNEELLSIPSANQEVIDLQGRCVLPGFTDSHIHLGYFSQSLQKIDMDGLSQAECISRVAKAARTLPTGTWILGHGWDHNHWPEGYGNAAMLDAVSPNHPVFLTVKSLHAAWANSKALQLAGIDQNTENPPGGTIMRNEDGTPNGILLESAYPMVESAVPEPSIEEMAQILDDAQKHLWKLGISSVHDFDQRLVFQGLQRLHQQNKLHLRVRKNLHGYQIPAIKELGLSPSHGDDMLHIGALKYFSDGAIGPHTAAMFEPFTNSDSYGEMLLSPEELDEIYLTATQIGFPVAMHAIGDRANHLVLNAIEKIRQYELKNHLPVLGHRIEHAQILQTSDVARFMALNVIASVQPYHVSTDIHTTDASLDGRGKQSFLFKSLLNEQVQVIFGSDAPVVPPNPFFGIFAAVARKNHFEDPVWHPAEALTIEEAITAYTVAPPLSIGMGNKLGKLAPGYYADMIVVDKNPVNISINTMKNILPVATIVNGEWVYSQFS
jgi:predicted amidohydrolase YtcJ